MADAANGAGGDELLARKESDPGLGCQDQEMARARAASGGLSDDSPEAPVANPQPFRNLQGLGRGGSGA